MVYTMRRHTRIGDGVTRMLMRFVPPQCNIFGITNPKYSKTMRHVKNNMMVSFYLS